MIGAGRRGAVGSARRPPEFGLGAAGVWMGSHARAETEAARSSGCGPLLDGLKTAEIAARAGLDKKAEEVRVLDVRGLASYADFLVLMTAASDRQVNAVADAVDEQLRRNGCRPIGIEGQGAGNWVLIDAGDVVVHVFRADARSFYDLDSLWCDARSVPVAPGTGPLPAVKSQGGANARRQPLAGSA